MRILVVEDHAKMANLLRRGLVEAGYVVDVAGDGVDGLHQATTARYDAIVLDVMLPGLDGFEVCRLLRARGVWSPVLMLTARDAVNDRVAGLDAGSDDYLIKPFAFSELLSRIRALLRRDAGQRPTVLRCGPLSYDPASRIVRCSDELVSLSAREQALLELFLRRPNEVISRTEILEHVWDSAYDGGSNVVDVYVMYLRDKIDRRFELGLFETVRGSGYRMVCPEST